MKAVKTQILFPSNVSLGKTFVVVACMIRSTAEPLTTREGLRKIGEVFGTIPIRLQIDSRLGWMTLQARFDDIESARAGSLVAGALKRLGLKTTKHADPTSQLLL